MKKASGSLTPGNPGAKRNTEMIKKYGQYGRKTDGGNGRNKNTFIHKKLTTVKILKLIFRGFYS